MLIQCLIERDGPTYVSVEKMDYVFTSRPHLTGGDEIAQTCEVISSSHSAYFLRIPGGQYIEYKKKSPPEKPVAAANETQKPAATTGDLTLESFFHLKNVAQVKSAIRKCNDTLLLNKIGAEESEMKTRRQWVIESLSARLEELEGE